jgi:hypothetical protein
MPGPVSAAPPRRFVLTGFGRRLRPWVGRLQKILAALAVVFGFQGRGYTAYWVVLFFAAPVLRLALSAAYRAEVRGWLAGLWRTLEDYPAAGATPWRAVLVFVVAPTAALLLLSNHGVLSGDSQPVMLAAVSLVRQGDWELSEYVECYAGRCAYSLDGQLPYFLQHTRGGIHSSYPSGMVTFAVPVAAVARLVGADLDRPVVRDRLERWTACWVAGGCLALFFLLALHRVAPAPAWVMTALLATGSALYSTVGQALWQHGGVILCALAALLLEFRQARRASVPATWLQGAACALMVACRLSSGLFVLAFAAWILARSPRRALRLGAAAALAYAPWAWLYGSIYGTPFGPSTGQLEASNWTPNLFGSLLGVLVSPARGLVVYQPWLLLAAAALLPAVRRRLPGAERAPCPAGWSVFCAAAVVLHLGLVSSWRCWWGGHCWGSRLASEAVPPCALLALRPLAALWSAAAGRRLVIGVGLLALLLHLPAVYLRCDLWNAVVLPGHEASSLWAWADPPFFFPFLHLDYLLHKAATALAAHAPPLFPLLDGTR